MNLPTAIRSFALVAAIAFAGHAPAQDFCLKAPDPVAASTVRTQVGLKRGKLCYDVKAHPPESLANAVKLLEKADKEQGLAQRRRTITSLLEALRQWAETDVADPALRRPLQQNLRDASVAVDAGERAKDIVDPAGWRVVERPSDRALQSKIFGSIDLAAAIDTACTGTPPQTRPCAAAIGDLEALLRSHALVEAALMVARKEELSDFADLYAKRAAMWDAYRTEARPQYPWEWLLNSAFYRDDRARDGNNNPIGPANVPRGQWIAAHPGVGLERFDIRGTDQSANNATLYMEWIGYNRLNWDHDAGKLRGGMGVSLISAYASRQDAKDWSHGIMFWAANKYGLAVTRNSDGTSVMVSMDLGELLRDRLNQWNRAIKADFPPR